MNLNDLRKIAAELPANIQAVIPEALRATSIANEVTNPKWQGTNVLHRTITPSLPRNVTAAGPFGLNAPTVQDYLKRKLINPELRPFAQGFIQNTRNEKDYTKFINQPGGGQNYTNLSYQVAAGKLRDAAPRNPQVLKNPQLAEKVLLKRWYGNADPAKNEAYAQRARQKMPALKKEGAVGEAILSSQVAAIPRRAIIQAIEHVGAARPKGVQFINIKDIDETLKKRLRLETPKDTQFIQLPPKQAALHVNLPGKGTKLVTQAVPAKFLSKPLLPAKPSILAEFNPSKSSEAGKALAVLKSLGYTAHDFLNMTEDELLALLRNPHSPD